MNKFKFLLTTLLFFAFVLSFSTLTLAADLNIDCPSPPIVCTKSIVDPFFNSVADGHWYPGKIITKTLNMKNSGSDTRQMALKGSRIPPITILENVMNVSITPFGGGSVIWSGSLDNFYSQTNIALGTFNSGANADYNFTVAMNSAADNLYKNLQSTFDLTLGFWGDVILPTPTPTPGGEGEVLGIGVSAPSCNDSAPGSAPILLSAVSTGANKVTLTWTSASAPVTYYLVSYRTSGGQQYGNPNVGGSGTTSYTVSGLSGGTTYHFKVRAGNGCMPGAFSFELSVAPSGGVIAGPATGFQENVLGINSDEESTPSGDTTSIIPSPTGEVKGIETGGTNYWWLLFFGAGGLILIYWFLRRRPS